MVDVSRVRPVSEARGKLPFVNPPHRVAPRALEEWRSTVFRQVPGIMRAHRHPSLTWDDKLVGLDRRSIEPGTDPQGSTGWPDLGQAMRGLPHCGGRVWTSCRPFSSSYRCHILKLRGSTGGGRPETFPPLESNTSSRFFSSCMFRPRPRISLVKTSKLVGVPASRVFSPLTMLS